jgi:hypothetical protein
MYQDKMWSSVEGVKLKATGLIGIIGWRIFFAVHSNSTKIILSQYLLIIWTGHLIYAVGTFVIYTKFQPDPVTAVIPVC